VFVTLVLVIAVVVVVDLYFIIRHANLHQNLLVKHGSRNKWAAHSIGMNNENQTATG